MSLEGEPQERRGETRAVKTYPLNSRRLMARIVHRIAAALELPKAPLSDARQMVEGSLGEGREPWSVQVDIVESESGSIIRLRDADGVFLEVTPDEEEARDDGTASPGGAEQSEVEPEVAAGDRDGSPGGKDVTSSSLAEETLKAARERVAELEAATQDNRDLAHEVRVLRERLKEESDKLANEL